MGEIAEMMLDGTLCEGCGVYLEGESAGDPRRCAGCRHDAKHPVHHPLAKTACKACGRRVKFTGLRDHMRDAHGPKKPA